MLCRLPGDEGNPGDVFIAIGLQQVLDDALGKHGAPLPWLSLSKFKPGHVKKHIDLVKEAGFLIIGGTPQFNNYDDWCFWYDREFWQDFIVPNNIKVFPLAGGGGYPSNTMNPREFADHCLKSEETRRILGIRCDHSPFFTVRDEHAYTLLKKFDRAPEVRHLACTATFAGKSRNIEWKGGRLLIVPPSPGLVPVKYVLDNTGGMDGDAIAKAKIDKIMKLFIECGDALGEEYVMKPIYVAHYFPEYLLLKQYGIPEDHIFFTNDYYRLLQMYATADCVLSARLHGALPPFGMCGPKVVHVGIDSRMGAIDYFEEHIPNLKIQDLTPEVAVEAMEEAQAWSESECHQEYWENQVMFYRERIRAAGFLQ